MVVETELFDNVDLREASPNHFQLCGKRDEL